MWQRFGIHVTLMLVIVLASTHSAVIRPAEPVETTTANTLNAAEETTTMATVESSTPQFAVSRDKDATVQIELEASVDPAPGTVEGDLNVRLDRQPQKSAKLLLLSTPAKRPAEVEQQFEEPDESETAAAGSSEANVPTTTPQQQEEQLDNTSTTEHTETTTEATAAVTTAATIDRKATTATTTKLFAIDATISSKDSSEPNVAVAVATDNATISIAEQPQPAGNNNVAIELALVEPEAEYVLLDTSPDLASVSVSSVTHDELQLGSFTHIDSDAHLQPVVHSVEIVPTRFDDPLIVNYVHNFR
ncbi:uncharacterized protein LOC133842607 [Drosophila sulfurigaster albostrigata]|uniref:uncharacterized protein LOC133842607 n=1 Tax=Drosophila sulfurigaster albostrigata TaxID=89887 RepID=UPI002D21D99C|nr:uncharacterized protein LOC133842607 [Drosophila sulfurigaster albostrigata]